MSAFDIGYAPARLVSLVGRLVTVEAGMSLRTLCGVLRVARLALPCVGADQDLTVGEALARGYHGTGLAHPVLAAGVAALELLGPTGPVRCSSLVRRDLFLAHLWPGSHRLPVVLVTLRAVPAFELERTIEPVAASALPAALADLRGLAASSPYTALAWTSASADWFQIRRCHRTGRSGGAPDRPGQVTLARGRSDVVLRTGCAKKGGAGARHFDREWALGMDAAPAALLALHRLLTAHEPAAHPFHYYVEVSFSAPDHIPSSPAFGRPVCWARVYVHGFPPARLGAWAPLAESTLDAITSLLGGS